MTGPTPIVATGRLVFTYNVDGLAHNLRQYCNWSTDSADPTGYGVAPISGGPTIGLSVAADRFWSLLGPMLSAAATTFGVAELQELAVGAYVPLADWSTSVAPSGGGGAFHATQNTVFMRDTTHKVHKCIFVEGVFGAPYKNSSLGALSPSAHAFAVAFVTPTVAGDMGFWARSRAANGVASFTSMIGTLNRKLRRRRGLA